MQRLFGTRMPAKHDSRRDTQAALPPRDGATSASASLLETLELLEKRIAHSQRLVDKELNGARTHQAANRRREALECIKRKKMHEKELEDLSVKKLNLMQTEHTLQALRFNSIVVASQADGAAAIEREIRRMNGVEGIEKVVDRAEDALADAGDVLGATSRAIGAAADLDEAELLEELEELEQLEMDSLAKDLSAVTTTDERVPVFAQVPISVPVAQPSTTAQEREEAELAMLGRAMRVEQPMPMPMMAACY